MNLVCLFAVSMVDIFSHYAYAGVVLLAAINFYLYLEVYGYGISDISIFLITFGITSQFPRLIDEFSPIAIFIFPPIMLISIPFIWRGTSRQRLNNYATRTVSVLVIVAISIIALRYYSNARYTYYFLTSYFVSLLLAIVGVYAAYLFRKHADHASDS